MVFREKNLNFLKAVEVNQLDVECERDSLVSQNSQKLGFFEKKMRFPKKPWIFQISLVLTYAVECDGISKFSQKPQKNLSCFKKKGGFFKKNQFFENG